MRDFDRLYLGLLGQVEFGRWEGDLKGKRDDLSLSLVFCLRNNPFSGPLVIQTTGIPCVVVLPSRNGSKSVGSIRNQMGVLRRLMPIAPAGSNCDGKS